MKHSLKITILLVILFFVAQILGLYIVNGYTEVKQVIVGNVTYEEKVWEPLPYNVERPEFEEKTSYIPLFIIILVSTLILIVIIKLGFARLWKLWFFLSVFFCLMVAFAVFVPQFVALILALIFALLKILKRNVLIHNFTELFIYGGLAAVFVPILNILSISILLILISIYDVIAVWKTKHMVKLAKFQAKVKLFAGILIPYGNKTAILGGGDIGFPLMFSSVVLQSFGAKAYIIPIFVSLALLFLLIKGEKNKFYPAMPVLTIGCFLGFLVTYFI